MEHMWDQEVSFVVAITSGGRGGGRREAEEISFPEKAIIHLRKMYKLRYHPELFLLVEVNIICFILPE